MKGMMLGDDGDLMLQLGGCGLLPAMTVGEVDGQIAEHVLRAYPGEFKEVATVGAHVGGMLCGSVDPFWRGSAKEMLRTQKIVVKRIDIVGDVIKIEL